MALTAQQVYNQSLGVQRGRVNQMYGRNLEILAREMRDARERTEANLEGRGVLRSGEANTARSRLSESEAAQRKYLSEDRGYQLSQIDLDEQARRAALAAAGSGTSNTPAQPPTKTPQEIANSFNLAKATRYDPYGQNARKTFNIRGGMGSRG